MSNEFAFVTLATRNLIPELRLWCRSIELFVGAPMVIIGDVANDDLPPNTNVDIIPLVRPFTSVNMPYNKIAGLRHGLEKYNSVALCDTDVLFLRPWKPEIENNGVTLSPHYINEHIAMMYGYFNAGFIGIPHDNYNFLQFWTDQPKDCPGSTGEQQCLDNWPEKYRHLFGSNINVGWWRTVHPLEGMRQDFTVKGGDMMYNDEPLISIHSHLLKYPAIVNMNFAHARKFNATIFRLMEEANNKKYNELLALMECRNVDAEMTPREVLVSRIPKPLSRVSAVTPLLPRSKPVEVPVKPVPVKPVPEPTVKQNLTVASIRNRKQHVIRSS